MVTFYLGIYYIISPGFSDEITYLFQNCISLEDSEFPFGIIREVIYFFVVLFCKMSSFKTVSVG